MVAATALKWFPRLLGALCAAGVVDACHAQADTVAPNLIDSTFVFNLGGFLVSTDTKARLNGESTTNPDIDFDRTFGHASDATRLRADALWRVTPDHHARFMYFDNSIGRSRVVDQDLEWGDYTFHAGGNVDSRVRFKIAELAYEYAFLHQPTYEVAVSLGVHYMDLSLQLSGAATLTDSNGNVTSVSSATKEGSASAPLPVVGLRAGWMLAPQWYVEAQGQYFQAKIGDYDGRITDIRVGATWMFTRNLGLGLGYDRFTTTVDVAKESLDGRFKLGYSGLQLFLTGAF